MSNEQSHGVLDMADPSSWDDVPSEAKIAMVVAFTNIIARHIVEVAQHKGKTPAEINEEVAKGVTAITKDMSKIATFLAAEGNTEFQSTITVN